MATSKIMIDEGTTTNLATNTFTEDTATKHVARSVLNKSDGTETGIASAPLRVDPTGTTTQPVSAVSLPLPTGASTSVKQDDLKSSVDGMSGKLPATLGQKTKTASMSVVLASDQDAVPVTGTFYQATQPVSASSLPLPTGASTEATLASIKAKTDNIPALGQAVAGSSVPVVLPSAQITTLTPQTNALTDAQLRATAVPVSGTFYQATQPVSGTITATPLTGTTVPIAVSSSGDTTLVSAVGGKKIKVTHVHFVSRGTVTIKWKLGSTYMGEEDYIVNTGISASSSEGVFVTGVGEALAINLSASINVGGSLTYIEV